MPRNRREYSLNSDAHDAARDFVHVKLSAASLYGRVVIGNLVVERNSITTLSRELYEQYADEYGLEEVAE